MAEGFFEITEFNSISEMSPGTEEKMCWGRGNNKGENDYLSAGLKNRVSGRVYGNAISSTKIPHGEFTWELHGWLPGDDVWELQFLAGHEINDMEATQTDDTHDFTIQKAGATPPPGEPAQFNPMMIVGACLVGVAALGGMYYMGKGSL